MERLREPLFCPAGRGIPAPSAKNSCMAGGPIKADVQRYWRLANSVIPAKAGIQELPAKAGRVLDPGSSPG